MRLSCGLLLVRKLSGETSAVDYALQNWTDRLAMHVDAAFLGS